METKMVYLVDRGTKFAAIATLLEGSNAAERKMLKDNSFDNSPYKVILYDTISKNATPSPHSWTTRTHRLCHLELIRNWGNYKSGDSVDVSRVE